MGDITDALLNRKKNYRPTSGTKIAKVAGDVARATAQGAWTGLKFIPNVARAHPLGAAYTAGMLSYPIFEKGFEKVDDWFDEQDWGEHLSFWKSHEDRLDMRGGARDINR